MKDIFEGGRKLPLLDEFYTIQGEGFHFGKAAYFVRIGGCDIGCSWCDTKYSWQADKDSLIEVESVAKNALKANAQTVVVTGGEPLKYNLSPLCQSLRSNNLSTFIETSGAYKLSGEWDWICLSPKRNMLPVASSFEKADELKVIVHNLDADLKWAEELSNNVREDCLLFLQSEWSRYNKNIDAIVEYVKQNPKWNISLQSHKFMRIP